MDGPPLSEFERSLAGCRARTRYQIAQLSNLKDRPLWSRITVQQVPAVPDWRCIDEEQPFRDPEANSGLHNSCWLSLKSIEQPAPF